VTLELSTHRKLFVDDLMISVSPSDIVGCIVSMAFILETLLGGPHQPYTSQADATGPFAARDYGLEPAVGLALA
jgi:hypothetical protein